MNSLILKLNIFSSNQCIYNLKTFTKKKVSSKENYIWYKFNYVNVILKMLKVVKYKH